MQLAGLNRRISGTALEAAEKLMFVSGHGFSRAVKSNSYEGFSCGYRGKNRRLSPRYPFSPWAFSLSSDGKTPSRSGTGKHESLCILVSAR
jgi:hypothetical protein